MSVRTDLTRWNRAGLQRFRYVDANAAELLESLRSLLATRFRGWESVQKDTEVTDPRLQDRGERLHKQLYGRRGNWGWEIARSFARACHVLTEHVDADANEGFLGTATQWDNLRRLVEMLDYHPAPPASASTTIALFAKPGRSGTVRAGLQIKHAPPDGGKPVLFETLDDINVDSALNELRLVGHDRSPDLLRSDKLVLEGEADGIVAGEPIVLERTTDGFFEARLVSSVRVADGITTLDLTNPVSSTLGFQLGTTKVHVAPADRLDPLGPTKAGDDPSQTGQNWLELMETPETLDSGDVLYIADGKYSYFHRVVRVKGRHLTLDGAPGPLDLQKAWVSKARCLSVKSSFRRGNITVLVVVGDLTELQGTTIADKKLVTGGTKKLTKTLRSYRVGSAVFHPIPEDPDSDELAGHTELKLMGNFGALVNPQAILVRPPGRDYRVDSYLRNDLQRPFPRTLITSKAKKSGAGDFTVVVSGGNYAWGRLENASVDNEEGVSRLTAEIWSGRGGGRFYTASSLAFSAFAKVLRPVGAGLNKLAVAGQDKVELNLPGGRAPGMQKGRRLLVCRSDDPTVSVDAEVVEFDGQFVTLNKPLPQELGFTNGNTVIHGNVVTSGHGESRPEKLLGSGSATASNQSFVLAVPNVCFVADSTMATGVRAAIAVLVGESRDGQQPRTWEQVSGFNASGPTDPHYVVRMTEDGFLRIEFGDGSSGRRLPGGTNNVRVRYRVGVGLSGNVPPRSFDKPAKAHPLVESVVQPRAATGGNDPEGVASMRRTGPAAVLSIDRAVSLTDFANLATRHSSVWQARAFSVTRAFSREETVEVVVVPADGVDLSPTLRDTLHRFLVEHAVPHIRVEVGRFNAAFFELRVTLRIKLGEFDPELVKAAVRPALLERFSLRRRGIGQALYLSEVFEVVENVQGVASSSCAMTPVIDESTEPIDAVGGAGGDVKVLRPGERQVLHLRDSDLFVAYDEWSP